MRAKRDGRLIAIAAAAAIQNMGDVLPFRKRGTRARTLCLENHHKWVVWKAKQFDVREGKLVTVYRCERCGKEKVTVL
jgi:hypothetical protein